MHIISICIITSICIMYVFMFHIKYTLTIHAYSNNSQSVTKKNAAVAPYTYGWHRHTNATRAYGACEKICI